MIVSEHKGLVVRKKCWRRDRGRGGLRGSVLICVGFEANSRKVKCERCSGRCAMRKRERSKINVEWGAQTDRDGNYTRPALAM